MNVGELNALPVARATELLTACCGSSTWVAQMVAARPFASRDALLATADRIWRSLSPSDWLEAFAHHPRIGETAAAVTQTAQGSGWSAGEQAGVAGAADQVRSELAQVNRDYEAKFGFIYIVCASGRSAEELLEIARARLKNSREAELPVAAEEQRQIMRLRLEKLL